MISKFPRPYAPALFLAVIAVLLSPNHVQAEESNLYKIGRAAAYASHCGHRDLVSELQARYGDYRDFRTGRRKNDLQKYDRVRLACGDLKKNLEEFLEEVRALEAQDAANSTGSQVEPSDEGNGTDPQVELSDEEKQAALDRIYSDIMASILAKDGKWKSDRRGRLIEHISTYRNSETRGGGFKSLAACLSWDHENGALSYRGWAAEQRGDWPTSKYFTVQKCRNLKARRNLACECVSVDRNDENTLSLPDHILSRYERLIDAEVNEIGDQPESSD
ncbi:hypothetical protein [Denitrobaculum tricleocarpae]|uniref:DUF1311 domain-containing protein n=1 Tax=Denitrobaculum tricleocarpae TaxID=2591009 RepID=A0A545T5I9_9PROT|nr:hypothetical protein [Denitrobaculum tricleocarpae]TQV72479.1 hypothetical protein FKG95_25760 [Denitrobaculum tricleocarpae]